MSYISKLYSGRIGSLAYIVGTLLSWGGFWLMRLSGKILPENVLLDVVEIVVNILLFIFIFSVFTKRLHDLNKSGWLSLLVFVPLANAILGIVLLFKPGSREINSYGEPPRGYKFMLQDLFGLN